MVKNHSVLFAGRDKVYEKLAPVFAAIGIDWRRAGGLSALLRDAKTAGLVIWDTGGPWGESAQVRAYAALQKAKTTFAVYSSDKSIAAIQEARRYGASEYLFEDFNQREMILRVQSLLKRKYRIACLGGGTGLFTLLCGIKSIPDTLVTSIVSMADDGGSSGRLMTEFGILPPGDVRRSLVALSNAPELMNDVLNYRFSKGKGLRGHSFGNLFLAALSDMEGSMLEAVRKLGDILNLQGIVLPITAQSSKLGAVFEDGRRVIGESRIDLCKGRTDNLRIAKVFITPEPQATVEALSAILFADLVVIGPGDLYTSVIADLLVKDVREAIHTTRAVRVYISNLMTKPGETSGYDLVDHVREIIKYLNGDALDAVLASSSDVSAKMARIYARKRQAPVSAARVKLLAKDTRAAVFLRDLGSGTHLVRHDTDRLRRAIREIMRRKKGGQRVS